MFRFFLKKILTATKRINNPVVFFFLFSLCSATALTSRQAIRCGLPIQPSSLVQAAVQVLIKGVDPSIPSRALERHSFTTCRQQTGSLALQVWVRKKGQAKPVLLPQCDHPVQIIYPYFLFLFQMKSHSVVDCRWLFLQQNIRCSF